MQFLLDTNICIYLIKNHPREVLVHFKKHSPRDVGISIITVFELNYGVSISRFKIHSRVALEKFGPVQLEFESFFCKPLKKFWTLNLTRVMLWQFNPKT